MQPRDRYVYMYNLIHQALNIVMATIQKPHVIVTHMSFEDYQNTRSLGGAQYKFPNITAMDWEQIISYKYCALAHTYSYILIEYHCLEHKHCCNPISLLPWSHP